MGGLSATQNQWVYLELLPLRREVVIQQRGLPPLSRLCQAWAGMEPPGCTEPGEGDAGWNRQGKGAARPWDHAAISQSTEEP